MKWSYFFLFDALSNARCINYNAQSNTIWLAIKEMHTNNKFKPYNDYVYFGRIGGVDANTYVYIGTAGPSVGSWIVHSYNETATFYKIRYTNSGWTYYTYTGTSNTF